MAYPVSSWTDPKDRYRLRRSRLRATSFGRCTWCVIRTSYGTWQQRRLCRAKMVADDRRRREIGSDTRPATIAPPMGLAATAKVFGFFSLSLWLTVAVVIPWLRDAYGISVIFAWYLSGTAVVLAPILLFGSAMAWLELPAPALSEWR